jgi:hypothetical protein
LELRAEREAAKSVLCPLHGDHFTKFAPYVWRPHGRPTHLEPQLWSWHPEQYIKAEKASFPSDRWPAKELTDPDRTIRYVLKDGTEMFRIELQPVYDEETGLPILENGKQLKAGPRGKLGFWEPSQGGDADPWKQNLSAAYRSWNYTFDPEYEINEGNAAKVLAKLHPMLNVSSLAEQEQSHFSQAAHPASSSNSETEVTIEGEASGSKARYNDLPGEIIVAIPDGIEDW